MDAIHHCPLSPDLIYQLALTQVTHIGNVHARILTDNFGSAEAIFRAHQSQLEKIEGIGEVRARSIKKFRHFEEQQKEITFIEKYKINPLFLTDIKYPKRLLNCYDPPTLLFYKGSADLNQSKIVAIIGTRNNSDYGKMITEKLVRDLAPLQSLVVSGLAFGIDATAHKSALKNNLPTVGVLGHGFDQIYPPAHSSLAKDMIREGGGLLTEFRSHTAPDKHNFPTRNRIVAGMCDAIIVVESGIKGGSMVTAELGNSYNKDVFAFPGRTTDHKSEGCNYLIHANKAVLISDVQDMIELMGWNDNKHTSPVKQKSLFVELGTEEKVIVGLLQERGTMHIDEINLQANLSTSTIAAAILGLELHNVVQSLPGKMYKLC